MHPDLASTPITKRLTPRQRLAEALTGGRPDVLPAAPCYLMLFLEEFQRANYIESYRRHLRGKTRCRVDHAQDTHFRAEALYQSYGVFKARPDWIEVPEGASRAWAERTDIVVQDGVLYYQDRGSGQRQPMSHVRLRGDPNMTGDDPSRHDIHDGRDQLRSRSDVDARLPVHPAKELLQSGTLDLAAQVVADYGDEYFISTILDPPFSDAYDLLGFEGLMLIQLEQPDLFHSVLQRKLEQCQQVLDAWAAVGIHGVYAEEVFTGADILSPQSYERFVFAYNQPYFRHLRKLGLLSIHYVCGDVVPRLDRIVELDVDAVAVEESKKNFRIEIEEVIERVAGRRAVLGNIDAVRFGPGATLEEMAAEVKRQAQVGARARGFVISTGSPFPLDTNPRLIDTLVSTAHSLAP